MDRPAGASSGPTRRCHAGTTNAASPLGQLLLFGHDVSLLLALLGVGCGRSGAAIGGGFGLVELAFVFEVLIAQNGPGCFFEPGHLVEEVLRRGSTLGLPCVLPLRSALTHERQAVRRPVFVVYPMTAQHKRAAEASAPPPRG